MRIITGSARGARLKAPKGEGTRPTADRVKESLFNILGSKVLDRSVLDLFAGTGSLGLEALSRGAASALLVDRSTAALLRDNARHTHLEGRTEILTGDVLQVLSGLQARDAKFSLVFCDPPYRQGLWQKVLLFFDTSALLSVDGILVVEHGADESEMPVLKNLVRVMGRRYGHTTQLSFFQQKAFIEGTEVQA